MLRQLSVVFLLFSLGIACGFVIEGVGAEAKPQLENDSTAYISELYPNPVAPYTPGEFVTIRFPPEANRSAYTLEDAHRSVSISPQERYLDGAETTELDPPPSVSGMDSSIASVHSVSANSASLIVKEAVSAREITIPNM